MSFHIEEITVRTVRLPQIEPFRTSFGVVKDREQLVIEMKGSGVTGWGESAILPFPFYNHETSGTALHILNDFAIPLFFKARPETPQAANAAFKKIIGHHIARAGVEMAYWDWTAKAKGMPLYKLLGGTRNEIPVGISVPLYDSVETLLEKVGQFVDKGYKKIKVKIAPGEDLALVERIVETFGEIPLMVDANSAYSLNDVELFRQLDRFPLMMIEQPLRADDIIDHAKLQKEIKNSICLDESIEHLHDAVAAAELGSCRIINIKPGRVGGLSESLAIHDYAAQNNIGVWCGGMLETGVGRALNMSVATLPNYLYPGDIGESARYYHEDIVDPEIHLSQQGTLKLIERPGIGFEINRERLNRYTTFERSYRPE